VRYEAGGGGLINGKVRPKRYGLAFLLRPGNDSEARTLLQGTWERQTVWNLKFQEVNPEPDAAKNLSIGGEGLALAIQCHARGWGKLAEHLLEQVRKDDHLWPRQALTQTAWYYLWNKLTDPKVDRIPIAKHMK